MSTWRSGGIAGFLERFIGGKAADIGGDMRRLQGIGFDTTERGAALGAEGVQGLRDRAGAYETMLATGRPMPASVYRAWDSLRSGVGDESMRSMSALRASIGQRRAAAGGFMSPEAMEEYSRLGESDVRDQTFDSLRDIGVAQSQQELAATQDLYGRLDAMKNAILNHGQFTEQLGVNTALQALLARLGRNKAIADTIVGGISAGMGGSRGASEPEE